MCLRYLNDACFAKQMNLWTYFRQDTSVVLERATVHNNVSSPMLEKWKSAADNEKTFGA